MRPVDSVIVWKWHTPGYRSTFGPETVNIFRRMVARNYPFQHRVICVTDDSRGIDAGIDILPLWNDFPGLQPYGGPSHPNCYRRLRLFHPDAAQWFGERYVSVDLDSVVTGDLTSVWNRPEDVVLWGNTHKTTHYNGSMVLMTAGARPQVWETFDPKTSPGQARDAGQLGSDQGWMSYVLGPGEAMWTQRDGVYSYRNDIRPTGVFPTDARLVLMHGQVDPWTPFAQRMEWVHTHYR